MMSGPLATADARADTRAYRQRLNDGEALEVAGYTLSPALAAGLERAELLPPPATAAVVWFEVSGGERPELPPAAAATTARWRELGVRVEAAAVAGPPFWTTVEIEECPQLIRATRDLLVHQTPAGRPVPAQARLGQTRHARRARLLAGQFALRLREAERQRGADGTVSATHGRRTARIPR
jgi:hypothetical protein